MYIYLDESGDLGYTLDKPYRDGGSSRFMTIAYMLVPSDKIHLPIRKVRNVYRKHKFKTTKEKKGADLSDASRKDFCEGVVQLLNDNPDIKIGTITVEKCNVHDKMKTDQNILYNFMIKLAIIAKISHEEVVFMVPDKKPIKVKDINQCKEYLQSEFEKIGSKTKIEYEQQESHEDDNLLFIDWICNSVWKHYEDNLDIGYNILQPVLMDDAPLFFTPRIAVGTEVAKEEIDK